MKKAATKNIGETTGTIRQKQNRIYPNHAHAYMHMYV